MKKHVLCSISTRGRYETTLPLAVQAVAMQTYKVDRLVIFDDNDEPKDLRQMLVFQKLFSLLDQKGIAWEVVFGMRKGQHHNHQIANKFGYNWVWRVDDDCIPDPNVLETLMAYAKDDVGAVGGAILTPPFAPVSGVTGLIENINNEPNIQWDYITQEKQVEHLHCSFLYRAGVYDYNLALSRAAHREETLFTFGLHQMGYSVLVVPNANTWHLKNQEGGIRPEKYEQFAHDEHIFNNFVEFRNNTIVVLDSGMGDHLVFKRILPKLKNPVVFSCYPDIIPGRSIQEAYDRFGNLDQFNVYIKMDQWGWTGSLEDAYEKQFFGDRV